VSIFSLNGYLHRKRKKLTKKFRLGEFRLGEFRLGEFRLGEFRLGYVLFVYLKSLGSAKFFDGSMGSANFFIGHFGIRYLKKVENTGSGYDSSKKTRIILQQTFSLFQKNHSTFLQKFFKRNRSWLNVSKSILKFVFRNVEV
jgi:hypothetical protein